VRGLRFTPDGKSLLSAAENGRLSVWDLETNQPTDLPPSGTVSGLTGLTMDADGRLAAACGWGGGVGLWNLTQKTPLLRPTHGHLGEVRAVTFGSDAQTLASVGDDRTLRLWDLTSGKERKVLEATEPLDGVTASSDGKFLAAAGRHGTLWVWDVEAGFGRRSVPAKHARTSVACSPTGPILASGLSNGVVELWRADRLDKPLHTLAAHTDKPEGVVEVAFSPNGKWLASTSRVDPEAKVWDVETGKRLAVLHHAQPPSGLAFVGDGGSLAVADGDGTVRFWQTVSWKPLSQSLASDGQQQLRLNCSPDGRHLAVVSPSRGTIRLFDVQTTPVREVRSWTPAGRLTDMAFAPDSRHLALASPNGSVYVLRARIAGE
jgi:WD40 repeat protein